MLDGGKSFARFERMSIEPTAVMAGRPRHRRLHDEGFYMWIVVSSVLLGLIGVVASRIGLTNLTADGASRDPHAYWGLGLVTLLPAWLVAFVGLLGTTPGARPQLVSGVAWLLSAAAGLIGAIATEARVRQTGDFAEAHQATRLWRLGVLAFLPAWLIVLSGHLVR